MKAKKPIALLRPILAMLPPLVAFILQSMLWSAIQPYVWFLFYPAVFFSSWIGGLPSGLMATVISTAIVWWFFIPPEHSFMMKTPGSLLSVGLFIGLGVLFSFSHSRLRKATKQAADALAAVSFANDQLETRVQERTVELAQANESLRASESKLQTIVENLAEGVAVSDLDGQLLHFNRAALEIHGFASLDECRRLTEFSDTFELAALNGAVWPVEEWPLARVLRGENLRDLEVRIRRIQTDWRRVFSYGGTLVHGADGQPLMAVVTISDISERKRAEEALLEARDTHEQRVRERTAELAVATEQAQAADRLKSEFLANMSHELRTPLNAIIGFAELMHDGKVGPVSSDHKEYLGDVITSARHLLELINDVLDLSKVEAGKMEFTPEPIHLTKIFAEARQILQTMAEHKRLTVDIDIATAIDQVIIDPAKLKQVLYNYLSNAIKFSSEKGLITLRALADGSDFFRLEVEDTGIGIAADQIDKLFTAFQQLDAGTAKKHQGTGLGLALTKRIVEAQGGHVGVRSIAGQGSVFYAVLPKIAARKFETSAERRMIAALAGGSANILVVEDDAKDLKWIAKILSEQGHSFDTARTGAEALAKAKATVYSAILLDLILPDMIGWDILHSMRAEGANQHTPVIVVTVVTEKEMVRGFPVQDYLTKPLSPQSLIDSLRSAGVQSNGARKKVLVVDDDPKALKIARAALQSSGYEAVCHTRGKSGLTAAAETRFDAIVLDLLMPEMDGFEFLDLFREIAAYRDTPVIVWTNKDITAKDRGRLERSAQSIALKGQDGIDVVLNELQRHVTRAAEALREERA